MHCTHHTETSDNDITKLFDVILLQLIVSDSTIQRGE